MNNQTPTKEALLSRREAEKCLGLAKGTLDVWASTKRYELKYYKIGRKAMYRQYDLDAFIKSRAA